MLNTLKQLLVKVVVTKGRLMLCSLIHVSQISICFIADISKAMQAKRKRLETFTKSSLKGSNQKLEQLWNTQYAQR